MTTHEDVVEQIAGQVTIDDILTAQTPVTLDDRGRDPRTDDPVTRDHVDRYMQSQRDLWDRALWVAEGIVGDYTATMRTNPDKALDHIRAALAANRYDKETP